WVSKTTYPSFGSTLFLLFFFASLSMSDLPGSHERPSPGRFLSDDLLELRFWRRREASCDTGEVAVTSSTCSRGRSREWRRGSQLLQMLQQKGLELSAVPFNAAMRY
ncbi:unnamed protein product, partial [Durusdinium trenchii]